MLIVETIAKVRRAYFSDGKSIKAICRELRPIFYSSRGSMWRKSLILLVVG